MTLKSGAALRCNDHSIEGVCFCNKRRERLSERYSRHPHTSHTRHYFGAHTMIPHFGPLPDILRRTYAPHPRDHVDGNTTDCIGGEEPSRARDAAVRSRRCRSPVCYDWTYIHIESNYILRVIVKFTVKNAVCMSLRLAAYGEFDCEFGFDSLKSGVALT